MSDSPIESTKELHESKERKPEMNPRELIGRRIESPFAEDGGLIATWPLAGDYWFNPRIGWCAVTPDGSDANLSKHQVIEHDDGTITVSPSILVSHPDPDDSNRYTGTADEMRFPVRGLEDWHGYLERGIWRKV